MEEVKISPKEVLSYHAQKSGDLYQESLTLESQIRSAKSQSDLGHLKGTCKIFILSAEACLKELQEQIQGWEENSGNMISAKVYMNQYNRAIVNSQVGLALIENRLAEFDESN